MADSWYYDFTNMSSAIKQGMIKHGFPFYNFRFIKDFVNTRIGIYQYKNLPDDLTSEIIETALTFSNNLCFYKSTELGQWVLCRYLWDSDLGIYMKPKKVDIMTLNGYTIATNVPYEDIIIVRDNEMDIPPFLVMCEYFERIDHVERDLFKILDVACLPIAIVGNKKQAADLKRTAKLLGNDNPFIIGDDKMVDEVKSFNIDLPITAQEVYDIRQKYIEELKASMGISATQEKRERLVIEEVTSQNEYTDFIYHEGLEERKRWVEELNEKAGFNIVLENMYDINQDTMADNAYKQEEAIANADAKADIKVAKESPKPVMKGGDQNDR